ncbi:MAG: hypothetical protein H7Y01_09080 [Ferruginibacter sp.]|nr:hypothetical protein [Chitinophagaceae bacterium]
MKKKKIILAIIFFGIIGGGWYAYSEYTRKVKDLRHVKAGLYMEATELITAFEKDETKSNALFLDKVIAVKGRVKTVEKSAKGHYTVILGDEGSMSSVRCSMDSVHQQDAGALITGAFFTMKGACTGFNTDELLGSDVILNRCVVEK